MNACLAKRYTRKSKTVIWFMSMSLRYGFELVESSGIASSPRERPPKRSSQGALLCSDERRGVLADQSDLDWLLEQSSVSSPLTC